MIDSRKTGAYISKLRKEKDWTQLDLSDRLHVTPQAVSRWETGDSFPDLNTLVEIGKVFRVSVDDLLDGEPVSQRAPVSQRVPVPAKFAGCGPPDALDPKSRGCGAR